MKPDVAGSEYLLDFKGRWHRVQSQALRLDCGQGVLLAQVEVMHSIDCVGGS